MKTIGKIARFVLRLYKVSDQRNIGLIAAGVAFFGLLAIFPGLAALIAVFGFFADPLVIQDQLGLLADLMPPAAHTLLANQVTRLVWSGDGTLGLASLASILLALFLARRGVDALLKGLNAVYGGERRAGLAQVLAVMVITLGMVLAGVVALLAVLVLPVILTFFPLGGVAGWLALLGRWAIALGMLALWLWVFYRIGPNRPSAVLWPGLVTALVLWVAASAGFSLYIGNFGNYNQVYGSIGAVIALLSWFYLSAYVVLLGGVVNALLDETSVTPKSDETAPLETL
ncbi:YihY/virulence factor BrkB family protein [Roseinatronobacter sp.]|uniref:YihY/virulence factor BrkB family protein n=1 Tax=Roseinatronobacter sp. TaxID=1945755 RepID=UPI0025FFBF1A|nr:YihY/virulence factor BrkB family protein [Roseibaca sp.]